MVTFSQADPGTSAKDWAGHPGRTSLPAVALDPDVRRLVVIAAHPDDESLGSGGLIARAHRAGLEIDVVAATDGEASHPASRTHSPAQLASLRRAELRTALDVLASESKIHALGFPDGQLADHEEELLIALVRLVGDGRHTLIVAPWRYDGHTDHEAAGRAAAAAAARTGARLMEYPIWFWHWGEPAETPWDCFRVLHLEQSDSAVKAKAQAAHRSQIAPLSGRPGDEALLSADFLRHFSGSKEIFVLESPQDTALDDLHADDTDPWGADSRWYEARKRSVILSALPRSAFRHGLEIGCSTGALAEQLATRCDDLLVLDASPRAVRAARSRLKDRDAVRVEELVVPRQWPELPDDGFDLIVLSEVGYFLSPRDLDELVERIRSSLATDGVLVLCHWMHDVVGWPINGPDVHHTVTSAAVRPVAARYRDRDFELLVLATPSELPDPQGDS